MGCKILLSFGLSVAVIIRRRPLRTLPENRKKLCSWILQSFCAKKTADPKVGGPKIQMIFN
jgi:hypothetical protein